MTEGKFYEDFIIAPSLTHSRLYNNIKVFYAEAKRELKEIEDIKNPASQRLVLLSWMWRWFGND